MLDGEYAWFAFFSAVEKSISQPWKALDISDDEDLEYRKKAYYAIKQVNSFVVVIAESPVYRQLNYVILFCSITLLYTFIC